MAHFSRNQSLEKNLAEFKKSIAEVGTLTPEAAKLYLETWGRFIAQPLEARASQATRDHLNE